MKLSHLSDIARYYLVFLVTVVLSWGLLSILNVEFLNQIFFIMAFVWHFALMTPDLKQKVFASYHRLSFLSVVIRVDHYLHLFIKIEKIPFGSSLIRGLSPLLFTFILFVLGGNGNLLFTLLGSVLFESIYLAVYKKWKKDSIPLVDRDDSEIPPAIPSEEINHE